MPSVLPSRWEEKVIFLEDFALPPCLLLFCVFVYGLEETKFICLALLHDAFKTFLAIISVVLSLVVFIAIIVFVISLL